MTDQTKKKLKHLELLGTRLKENIERKKAKGESPHKTEALLNQIRARYIELSQEAGEKTAGQSP